MRGDFLRFLSSVIFSGHESYSFASNTQITRNFKLATGARLYRILHWEKPQFYRQKLGRNKRRAMYFRGARA